MGHLFVKEQLIEKGVSFGDESEFYIHSKLVNDLQGINSSKDSEYNQESNLNSYMDVDRDTQQNCKHFKSRRENLNYIY